MNVCSKIFLSLTKVYKLGKVHTSKVNREISQQSPSVQEIANNPIWLKGRLERKELEMPTLEMILGL